MLHFKSVLNTALCRLAAPTFIFATLLMPHLHAAVIVVDQSGAGSFTTIQAAIDNAADGDTVLIKGGSYQGFAIDGKSLVLTAELNEQVAIPNLQPLFLSTVTVKNIGATQRVSIRGVDAPAILLDNSGPVQFEDCELIGLGGSCTIFSQILPEPGVTATASNAVSFTRCLIRGGQGGYNTIPTICSTPGGTGMVVTSSSVALYETSLEGGQHHSGAAADPLEDPAGGVIGADGNLGAGRSFVADSPIRKSQPGSMQFAGQPGDLVLLLIAGNAAHLPVPHYQGALLVGPITAVAVITTLPPSGQLTVPLTINDLPPAGIDAVTLHLQAAFGVSSTAGVIGSNSVLTVLDPGI